MSGPTGLVPGTTVPDTTITMVGGASMSVRNFLGSRFGLLVFYRGLHCPKCKQQLLDVQDHLDAFDERGTKVLAISMDPKDRAEQSRDEWGLDRLSMAYGLKESEARDWGLHISTARNDAETKTFNEPGLFLVRADGSLYASWVQTVPFARPQTSDLLSMIDFIVEKDYPPRGTKAA